MGRLNFYFGKAERMRKKAARLPRTAIAEAPDGARIKVVGRVELIGESIVGRGAGWLIDLEAQMLYTAEARIGNFAVRDESGARAVVLAGAVGASEVAFHHDVELFRDGEEHSFGAFSSAAINRQGQAVLAVGEEITVIGVARREAEELVLTAAGDEPLVILDSSKD